MRTTRFIFTAAFAILLQTNGFADPVAELTSFSAFKSVDLPKMAGGEVLSARLPAMGFPRGLTTQFCYVVPAGLQKTVELHERWLSLIHI